MCLSLYTSPKQQYFTILALEKLLGYLSSTIQTILQQEQIKTFQLKNSSQKTLPLGSLALEKLNWCKNINL